MSQKSKGLKEINVARASTPKEFEQCLIVTKEAWKNIPELEQIPTHIMKASSRTGQFLVAKVNGRIVGYSMSFSERSQNLYLHALGVREKYQSSGIGEAIMLAMKEDAAKMGFRTITLTYSPLIGQNANLYVHKMHGRIYTYEDDAYGRTRNETIRGAAPSDRFLVRIELNKTPSGVIPAPNSLDQLLRLAVNQIKPSKTGLKIIDIEPEHTGEYLSIEVPSSMEAVKRLGPNVEARIVLRYREIFKQNLGLGHIVDFISIGQSEQRRNFYLVCLKRS